MSNTYVSNRVHYGEIDKIDLLINFLEKARNILNSDEDSELIIICDVENSTIRFHMAKLSEAEIINPNDSYEVDIGDTIFFGCAKDILDDNGNWTHFAPKY